MFVSCFRLIEGLELPETPKLDHLEQILCKVAAVVLNPVELEIINYSPVTRFDSTGDIVCVGQDARGLKIGDRYQTNTEEPEKQRKICIQSELEVRVYSQSTATAFVY